MPREPRVPLRYTLGYRMTPVPGYTGTASNGSLWCARKGSQSFLAYTGPELLGLVALREALGENWNQQQPDVLGELFDKMEQ